MWPALIAIAALHAQPDVFPGTPEHASIGYFTRPVRTVVTELNRRIESGAVRLEKGDRFDFLRSVLTELRVPVESQMLVFSKTSLQRQRISPRSPRALYFNDSVAVGWVPGGFIEVAAFDAQQGAIFYRLEDGPRPSFVRDGRCLSCH